MIRRTSVLAAVVLAALAAAAPASATSLPERTARVSATPGALPGAGDSTRPAISPAGRLVAFDSTAPDLTADPNGTVRDVFLRDAAKGTTRLVSAPLEGGADGPSDSAAIAGAGDLIAFVSAATNLVAGDQNGRRDIFVRAGLEPPVRISALVDGGEANGDSTQPDISRSGQTVVFTSAADNLVPGDRNGVTDVFAVEIATKAVRRISQPRGGDANGASQNPAISPDGRYVSFSSEASNLVRGDRNRLPDVFLADRRTGRIERVSVSSRETAQNLAVVRPFVQVSDVSAGGRYVVFDSDATNLVARDRNQDTDVFLRDRRRGTTTRISLSSAGEEATNDSFAPSIGATGKYVAFESFAEDLAPGDSPRENVFIHDVKRGITVVADVTSRGSAPRGPELVPQHLQRPVLSDDGLAVAFSSTAANLAGPDSNGAEDVFVRSLAAPSGGFARAPARVQRTRQPTIRLVADDPAATLFLCSIDGRRRICGLRSRLPRLAPGRHVLRVSAGGPGMLYSSHVSSRTFRVQPRR